MLHALLGLAYLLAFWNVYINYLSVVWAYAGFIYRPMSVWQIALAALGVMAVAFTLPTRLRAPSGVMLWLLFAFVYVPTMAQTFMLGGREAGTYTLALVALTGTMLVVCWVCGRSTPGRRRAVETPHVERGLPDMAPHQGLAYGFVVVAVLLSALLLFQYRSILTIADITSSRDVYASRFAAADMTSGIIAYVRIYYSYVVGPAVLAFGLISRRYRWFMAPGLSVFLISYMIDGSKISVVMPLAMMAAYAVIRWAGSSVLVMTGAIGALTLVSGLLTNHSPLVRFVADLVLLRSIAVPGQQFALYYDLFGSRGYTWWSNVRGISLFVPPPSAFAADPRWPVLGQIVGEEYYGVSSQTNSNANLFAGEGVAAAGPLGVVVIGLFLAVYLRILDRSAIGWHHAFVSLVMVPVGLALTNVHLSTMLLSFGGAFWVALFVVLWRSGTLPEVRRR